MPELSATHLQAVAWNIDQLVTVEVRMQGQALGVTPKLAAAAREIMGSPLCLAAAAALLKRVGREDPVVILTGTGLPPYLPAGETDGPPGAAALVRALQLALGARTVLVSELAFLRPIGQACAAMGFRPESWDVVRRVPYTTLLHEFPLNRDAQHVAEELLDRYRPAAVIAIERTGANRVGVRHSSTGMATVDPYLAHVEHLIAEARSREIFTVGIGDNGNEIGFGVIEDAVRAYKPFGERCECPCGQGIADHTIVDALIVASVSNWGAYGLAAALALMQADPTILHSAEDEQRVLLACTAAGAVDGATGAATPTVDGIASEIHQYVVRMLDSIVRQALRVRKRDF